MPPPHRPSRLLRNLGVGMLGLAVGVGAALVLRDPGRPAPTPSVQRLNLPRGPVEATVAERAQARRPVAPGSAEAAAQLFLWAAARGETLATYDLLDRAGHARYPAVGLWELAQADRLEITGGRVTGHRPAGNGVSDVAVEVTHPAAIDPFDGLSPGRTVEVWRVRREAGQWRVAADPVSVRPLLPSDRTAPAAVQAWLARLAACDDRGAAALQALPELYGPEDLPALPCKARGPWRAGAVRPFGDAGDPAPYVSAFGPDAESWGRVV
ncbi:MAG TPA: hypothetical protein VG276_01450, partial [Actinomycetes bacterium]|nr:hypothetical protein [Actinomycetes bacterium]